jgi:hypothetical protein
VRRFLERFDGQALEVALEATTGWRFVVEEVRRVGAEVHLAEPAETSAVRGPKKRAKTDWADARHLRELLLICPGAPEVPNPYARRPGSVPRWGHLVRELCAPPASNGLAGPGSAPMGG